MIWKESHFIDWLRAFSMLRSPNTHISHSAVGPLKFNVMSVPAAGNVLYIFIYKFYSHFFCCVIGRLFTMFFKNKLKLRGSVVDVAEVLTAW